MKYKKIQAFIFGALFSTGLHIVGFFSGAIFFFFDFLADIVEFIIPKKYYSVVDDSIYSVMFLFGAYSILLGVVALILLYLYKKKFGLQNLEQYFYGILPTTILATVIYILLFFQSMSGTFFLM